MAVPAILLATVMMLTTREPPRGAAEYTLQACCYHLVNDMSKILVKDMSKIIFSSMGSLKD